MPKTYIIGDVHGMFDILLALLNKLPTNAKVVFAGDLIDRGSKSAEVVKFVRDNNFAGVLGNHEDTFIKFFKDFFNGMKWEELLNKWEMWLFLNGGIETLDSYNFMENTIDNPKILNRIKSDFEWMQQLPIYLELDAKHKSDLPIVVSHSNITKVWHLKDNKEAFKKFRETALRTRDLTCKDSGILNIFGHTPVQTLAYEDNCINVDTGCCYNQDGFGKLTAYCVEDDEFISVSR